MTNAGERIGAHWWHHVLLWSLLVAVPAAKSWQVVADDPLVNDFVRQCLIIVVVVAAATFVVARARSAELSKKREEQPATAELDLRRRVTISLGLRADPEFEDGRTLRTSRWGLALSAAALASAAATSGLDGWGRWPVAAVAAVVLAGLVVVEVLRYRVWNWQRDPALRAHPTALWSCGPLTCAALGAAIALGVKAQASGLDGGRLVELVVITAFGEELIFRGCLLVLAYRVLSPSLAHVVVSLSFGLWHVGDAWAGSRGDAIGEQAVQIAGTVFVTSVGGLFFIFLRQRGRTLLAPTLGHVATNLPGIAL